MKKNYINKTTYTISFYQKIARFNSMNGTGFYVLMAFITLFTYIGFKNLSDEKNRTFAIYCLSTALLTLPAFCYVLPMLNAKKNYERMLSENENRELTITTELSDKIKSFNSDGGNITYKYDQIKEIREFKDMLVIIFKDDQAIYLDSSGFEGYKKEDVLEHLVKYSKIVPKK